MLFLPPQMAVSAASQFVCVVLCGRAGPLEACDGFTYHPDGTCLLLSGAGDAERTDHQDGTEGRTFIRLPDPLGHGEFLPAVPGRRSS